jgi:hypothetical protein
MQKKIGYLIFLAVAMLLAAPTRSSAEFHIFTDEKTMVNFDHFYGDLGAEQSNSKELESKICRKPAKKNLVI